MEFPACTCERCNPMIGALRRFTFCPNCGNKRCPKGTDHDLTCTNSNEPGQVGSSWAGYKP
jgi:NADH pyrophosphatase NudC (nudix superfamily)